jgi:NADPH:quinone reductase-like Zn-dependent oxidoreductase
MKAVVFEEHGGPEVLSYTDIPEPEPGPHEVLIEVRAAGANFNDIWARRGMPGMKVVFPHVAGSDVAGVVRAVGAEVGGTGFGSASVAVGDEVVVHPGLSCRICEFCTSGQEFFCRRFLIWGFQTGPNDGGHSELVTLPAANVLRKPANLSFVEAASMPLVLETAWRMLVSRARVQAGENVLIWGGVGGLGVMAIQICRHFGANPIPVVGGAEKVALAEELGAHHVIDRTSQDVVAEVKAVTNKVGVDIVFEHTGESTWPTSVAALRWGGRVVVCGASTGYRAETDLRFLWNKQQNLLGSHLSSKAELHAALRAVEAGHIRPVVGETMSLREVPRGQRLMEDLKVQGKVVYVPEG